jgi:hypothetical protein
MNYEAGDVIWYRVSIIPGHTALTRMFDAA